MQRAPRRLGVRLWVTVAAVVVVVVSVAAGIVLSAGRDDGPTAAADVEQQAAPTSATTGGEIPVVERPRRPVNAPAVLELPSSPPAVVDIPAIGVRSGLQDLRLDAAGALEAPTDFQVAGWFVDGTEPGQPGPAVIAGHVDSQDGPAIFFRLAELVVGDEILVERQDGQVVHFRVTELQRHPKDAFPADAVYGPTPGAELRLITCDGPFDRANNQYRDNLIVFAVAADQPTLGVG